MSTLLNAIIYARKSRGVEGLGEGESLEVQRESLVLLAKNKGYQVIEIFEEVASSIDEERKQLNSMIKLIESGEVDAVFVTAIDRLARSVGIFEKFLQACKDHDVKVETPMGSKNFNNSTEETLALLESVLAKSEYTQIRRRLNQGKVDAVQVKKRWIGTTPPFGYAYNKELKTLVPEEETQRWYRKMVDMAMKGYSFHQIAEELNALGSRTKKGNPWVAGRVQKILKNRTYLGEAEYNSSYLKTQGHASGCHEALITYEEFEYIQMLSSKRNQYTDKSVQGKTKTMLDNLIYCGKCKRKVSVFEQRTTKGRVRKTPFFMARTCIHINEDGSKCDNGGCKAEHIEETVIDFLKSYQEKIKKEINNLKDSTSQQQLQTLRDSIKDLEKDISKVEDQIKRATDVYIMGVMEIDEYTKRKDELTKNKSLLETELLKTKSRLESVDVRSVAKFLNDRVSDLDVIINDSVTPIKEKNAMMRKLIERIEFTKEKGVTGRPSSVYVKVRGMS